MELIEEVAIASLEGIAEVPFRRVAFVVVGILVLGIVDQVLVVFGGACVHRASYLRVWDHHVLLYSSLHDLFDILLFVSIIVAFHRPFGACLLAFVVHLELKVPDCDKLGGLRSLSNSQCC